MEVSTPSLGDTGIHLPLGCPSSFQLHLAVCLYSTETHFKYLKNNSFSHCQEKLW